MPIVQSRRVHEQFVSSFSISICKDYITLVFYATLGGNDAWNLLGILHHDLGSK